MNKPESRLIILSFFLFLLAGCGQKKKVSLSGQDPVDVNDFIASFQPLKPPYQFSDTVVAKKRRDSLLISPKVFMQFVPDTVLGKVFDENLNVKIYPIGRVVGSNKENYLFLKAFSSDQKAAFLVCFDKKNKFLTGMTALEPDDNPATQQLFNIDKRFTISKTIIRKNANGTISDGKDVYVLNESGRNFTLIMTDALDEKAIDMINPIDTASRKQKFSADYIKDKRNLVSIRDDKKTDRVHFFIHFEQNNGACTGELKGEAIFISPKTAIYHGSGDPCQLQMDFTSSTVTLKEIGGCGSHRGIDCVFEGTFNRKKEIKKPQRKIIIKPGKSRA
jgi:hypothetical protein